MFKPFPFVLALAAVTALAPVRGAETAPRPEARKKLVMLIAEPEYDTARTLPAFAQKFLSDEFRVVVVPGAAGENELGFVGIEEVRDADVLLVSVRRRTPPKTQLDLIRAHVQSGKPVVGIRTASHAFSPARGRPVPAGGDAWPEWDAQVIGGSYTGHHASGPEHTVGEIPDLRSPVVGGVRLPFRSKGSLYKVSPLQTGAQPLLTGAIAGQEPEPVAWTFTHIGGGRTFYTSLGYPADFDNEAFQRLLANGIRWAAAAVNTRTAMNGLRTPADLALDLVAQEPVIAQPVFLNFDERGRMWVVEYLQYPEPAGLKMVSRDSVWRAIYDKKKPPPPYDTPEKAAFRGKDRIVILEDIAGDGSFSKKTTFIEGLNITTAVCRGRGGIWVLSPPQLLFYPDGNADDVPDGPPVTVVDGFGLEDSHSVANSLRWGPDGWLYGAVGSTVMSDIVRPGLDQEPLIRITGQGIWRYHPETKRFEMFAEGGGNTFGVEIDAKGRIFSGHNGGDTRGFHYVQGGYLRKGFEKHGELSNPYAFGYFPQMKHARVPRFTHNFIVYDGGALPKRYDGKLLGVDPINSYVPLAEIRPLGATFATEDIDAVISSEDSRFRPVDIKHGPDGAIYVADWHDFQINHYRNHEGKITREDGRIYRVRAASAKRGYPPFDLTRKSSAELIELLTSENRWWRETALQVLADRRDSGVIAPLREVLSKRTVGQHALEALWALNLSGGFDEQAAFALLQHPDPHVRTWTVRLLGDNGAATPEMTRALSGLAGREPNVEVRSQLAASAKRFPAGVGLPIVWALLQHDEDLADPYIPLQLWWALESKCGTDAAAVVAGFRSDAEISAWRLPVVRTHILSRLMRRFAAAGGTQNFLSAAKLLDLASDAESRKALIAGFEQAFEGRSLPVMPDELVTALVRAGGGSLSLRVRQHDPAAVKEALNLLSDPTAPTLERVRLAATFGEVPHPAVPPLLMSMLAEKDRRIVRAALTASAAYDETTLTRAILDGLPRFAPGEQTIAQSVLTSRRAGAEALLQAIENGQMDRKSIPTEMQEKMRLVDAGSLAPRLDQIFGAKQSSQPQAHEQEIARVVGIIQSGQGSPYQGRTLYEQRCAACHKLHNVGGDLAPDLTSYDRQDIPSLVLNIVNPNAEIREGYEPVVVTTTQGQTHAGFLVTREAQRVIVRDMAGITLSLRPADIGSIRSMGQSLMPQGLLQGMDDSQLRHLFAYLRSTQPLVGREEPPTASR
jgi:putative membrane-bound dehydrogenase-like protein